MPRLLFTLALTLMTTMASAATYEARSERFVLAVDVTPEKTYDVRVTDLTTNQTVLTGNVAPTAGKPGLIVRPAGDLYVTVRIVTGAMLRTELDVDRGDTMIDSIRAAFQVVPQHARIHAEGAKLVGGDVKAPVVVTRIEPAYTDAAREDRISGIVILEILVDKTGNVKDAVVLKGLPDGLSESALNAVKQWKFAPATENGQPVDAIFNLTVNFKLSTPTPPPPASN